MTFPSIRIEGAILSGDLLAKLDKGDFVGQRPADFCFDSQAKLKEEIVRAWTAAQAFYTAFQHKLEGVKEGTAATSETRNQWMIPLLGLLGYAELEFQSQSELVGDKPFRLSHHLRSHGGFRVHIVGARESLDKKPATGPRVSPHAHLQEYLNLTEHLYGIVTNGKLLRLLRDSTRLIKLSYVEFDLDRMFGEELFADFAVLYRLLHVTRLPRSPEKSSESLLERYHQDALESGARIRDGLSFAVEQVVQELGSGFLARNENLRDAVADNSVTARELHHALLRLIYRLLLMMVAEERGLLFTDAATPRQRKLYLDHYSINRLRRLAERRALADSTKHDLWRGLRSTFRLFETDGPGAPLGLTGLGGQLFSAAALGLLQAAELDNGTLLSALAKLSLFRQPDTHQLSRVNYGALATEEFGSVYERLLELHPVINPATGNLTPTFGFKQAAGNERKTTGSYYTPSSLVECLLDSALDPVLDDRLKNFAKLGYKSADEAVLALKVCDPACGSGHFLIAAAQRIARRLALLRSKGDEPSVSELRHTLREVIGHCIYGVDINPMSVELCKVGLWLEAMEAGKPLSFLDHHIRCGNSLLGATPALIAEGIPDDAFTAIEGDDKKACAALKKLNAREKLGFGELFALEDSATFERLQQAAVVVENLPDDSVRAVEQKSFAFEQLQHNYDFERATDLANLWCAAFVIPKRMADGELRLEQAPVSIADKSSPASTQAGLFGESFAAATAKSKASVKSSVAPSTLAEAHGITSGHLRAFAKGELLPAGLFGEVRSITRQYNFFHWHLAFPEVFRHGGFGVVLGNPPWERVNLEARQFFATIRPDIAEAMTSKRRDLLKALASEHPELMREFQVAQRHSATEIAFFQNSGAYPHLNQARLNTYILFTELSARLTSNSGRCGIIVPSGVATDDTSKHLFSFLIENGRLVSLFDFENRDGLFAGVHRSYKFCLLTLAGEDHACAARLAFFLHQIEHIRDENRLFSLTAEELKLLSPITSLCPTFRCKRDREIVLSLYGRVKPLVKQQEENIDWLQSDFLIMFRSDDSAHLYRTIAELGVTEPESNSLSRLRVGEVIYVPVWESKLLHQFDHRFATFAGVDESERKKGNCRELTTHEKESAWIALPRHWSPLNAVNETLASREWKHTWTLGYRDITNATNERTAVASCLPEGGAAQPLNLYLPQSALHGIFWLASMNSLTLDYVARQRIGGLHLNITTCRQLPIVGPASVNSDLQQFVSNRVLELVFTSPALETFAQDCGWFGPPFRWDEDRRFQLRCELDAAFFHLYGLNRDDTAYILDTFPIVKRKDEEKHGHYRTKDRILEIYDLLAECQRTSKAYQTELAPIAASFRCIHAPRLPVSKRVALESADKFLLSFIYAFLKQTREEATFGLLDSVFHLLRHRANHASEFVIAIGDAANAWLSGFNDKPSNEAFLPFLKRLEADGWITADRKSGGLKMTEKFPAVPLDAWRNYDVSAALRVIAERPDIAELVVTQPNTARASHEFRLLKTA
jgi:type I restriction-modification system DNA methylase subunit